MKELLVSGVLIIMISALMSSTKPPSFEPVAVIELFTSQGCSSCPPADQLLSKVIADSKTNGKKVYALSFHVDYWNRLGWTDPFSDKKYSQRQEAYAAHLNPNNIYTPQMIVNGKDEFVGSDSKSLNNAILDALHTNALASFSKLVVSQTAGKHIHVYYELDGNHPDCEIHFALVSLSETTSVKRGENGGKTLKNENIVRQFISNSPSAKGEIDFAMAPVPSSSNGAVIAFVQQKKDLKIIGAGMVRL